MHTRVHEYSSLYVYKHWRGWHTFVSIVTLSSSTFPDNADNIVVNGGHSLNSIAFSFLMLSFSGFRSVNSEQITQSQEEILQGS